MGSEQGLTTFTLDRQPLQPSTSSNARVPQAAVEPRIICSALSSCCQAFRSRASSTEQPSLLLAAA